MQIRLIVTYFTDLEKYFGDMYRISVPIYCVPVPSGVSVELVYR